LVYELYTDSDYWECLGRLGKPELEYEYYSEPNFPAMGGHFELAEKFPGSGAAVFSCLTWLVKYVDFPCRDISWPVMSRRMYEIIAAQGEFKHETIPVVVSLNGIVDHLEVWNGFDWVRPSPYLTNYVALNLLEHVEGIIDWDNSVHEWESSLFSPRTKYLTIKSYALNEPEGGFPPVFRLAEYPRELFINRATREALKDAGITGVSYVWPKGDDPEHPHWKPTETDIKVKFPRSFFREGYIDPQFDDYFFDEPGLRRVE
jgi:hypothetical protein